MLIKMPNKSTNNNEVKQLVHKNYSEVFYIQNSLNL